ncbi:MAG: PAS domain-containing protein [Flavisolibacter sp.]|nr:PAS domain-containing protein [Flavisolibacter sp.]
MEPPSTNPSSPFPGIGLSESQEPLSNLADAMPQLVWIAETDGTVIYYNDRVVEFSGVSKLPNGKWQWEGLLHTEDLHGTLHAWNKAVQNGLVYEKEHRIKMKDGSYRWHLSRAFPQKDAHGRIIKWYGTATDIHEQKEVEEKIKEAEERWRTALEAAQIGTWDFNPQTKALYFSDVAKKIRGMDTDPQQALELHFDTIHPDDVQYVKNTFQQALSLGRENLYAVEYRIRIADQIRWIKSVGRVLVNTDQQPLRVIGVIQDVTEQREAARLIKESEERYATTVEASDLGLWDFHVQPGVFFAYGRLANIFGIASNEAFTQEVSRNSIHPEDKDYVLRYYKSVIQGNTGPYFSIEYRIIHQSTGTTKWIRTKGKAFYNDERKMIRTVGTVTDITTQKEAEQALAYQKQLLETVTSNTTFALFLMDDRQHCIYMNEAAEKMTGFKLEELQGKQLQYYIHHTHPDGRHYPLEECPIDRALPQKKRTQGEEVFVHKDGTFYSVAFTASPIVLSNKPVGTVIEVRDTTEEKKAEQALRISEERFRLLTNTIPQIVWTVDKEGKTEYVNDQWYTYTGQTPEEAQHNRVSMIHPDDVKTVLEKWQQSLAGGKPFEEEYRLKNKNTGVYRWFFAKVQPLRDNEERVTKWIGAATDIQHFKESAVLLEQQVKERTAELNRLNAMLQKQTEELQRSNEDLQQFAHVASHDLKEPLRKIKTFGSRLEDEFKELLPESANTYLEKMQTAADRMYSMIDGVLQYSMLDTTEQTFEPVDLNDTIRNIESDLEVLIQQKKATFHYTHLPTIEGTPVLIYQLFYNLINNSLKFSRPEERPYIRIYTEELHKEEIEKTGGLSPLKTYIKVIVEDNGIGFDEAMAERIFQTFTRLNAKEKYEGTGLGLALCKKIVQRHGGIITASGKENEGARFTLILPVKHSLDEGQPVNRLLH